MIEALLNFSLFEPTGASVDLFSEVDAAIKEINSRRPLSSQITEKLETEILYDRVHSSAVTEGNRLSRRETIVVLTTGVVEAGPKRDVLEVRNLAEAILELQQCLDNKEKLAPLLV